MDLVAVATCAGWSDGCGCGFALQKVALAWFRKEDEEEEPDYLETDKDGALLVFGGDDADVETAVFEKARRTIPDPAPPVQVNFNRQLREARLARARAENPVAAD